MSDPQSERWMTIDGERVNGRDDAKALLESKPELASRLRLQVFTHAGNEALPSKQAAGDASSLGRRDRDSVADRSLLSTWRTANAAQAGRR